MKGLKVMEKLFIAEKPSLARAIASHLWPDGNYTKKVSEGSTGYFIKDEIAVTWSFGHIIGIGMPEDHNPDWGPWTVYPFFPDKFVYKVKTIDQTTGKENKYGPIQFQIISALLKKADRVINAGDPDREGQTLVDEILELAGYTGPVDRILINAMDETSVNRAFDNMQDNGEYRNLYIAGQARDQSDWLIGMNLSRAFSNGFRNKGNYGTWRVGRVKTPTLALVVNREKEIANFKPHNFYELRAMFNKNNIKFFAKLIPKESTPTDSEGRIIDKSLINLIQKELENTDFTVVSFEEKPGLSQPPLPYSLDTLQVDANKKLHISPKETLDIIQKLYESKVLSYPRSDCNYIPEAQKDDAEKILKVIQEGCGLVTENAHLDIVSKCWNDSKITAHHAIIPTTVQLPEDATDLEQKVYKMVALRYLIQFYPPMKYNTITFLLKAGDETFKGTGKLITHYGFKALTKDIDAEKKEDENTELPQLTENENLGKPVELEVISKATTPPKFFDEGDIIKAMANIHKFLPADNPYREKLQEIKGIGTPATRSSILNELLATMHHNRPTEPCLTKDEKNKLHPTSFGNYIVENCHDDLIKPDLTAMLEMDLSLISEGKMSIYDYLCKVQKMILQCSSFADNHDFPKYNKKEITALPCPICKKPLTRIYLKDKKQYKWLCENCKNSKGYKYYYDDKDDKALVYLCPTKDCYSPLQKVIPKDSTKSPFWVCDKCKKLYSDNKGKPLITLNNFQGKEKGK